MFRLAGFRLDSRELIMQVRGLGGRPPEPRLRLHHLTTDDSATRRIIDEADVVVAALGYRPRPFSIFQQDGSPLELLVRTGPQMPLVDNECRVLDAAGDPLPQLFGIGLAAGFVPSGHLGGEITFRGQANGLWLWQHDVGSLIINALAPPISKQRRVTHHPASLPALAKVSMDFMSTAESI